MISLQEIEGYGDTFAAAVYLCSATNNKADADRGIAKMLDMVFQFIYSTRNIIIIDSYIDRTASRPEWDRLLKDAGTGRFQGVLYYEDLKSTTELQTMRLLLIDING
jgi:CelD/BcsL family acetyltransferase involved in cellulose biosynthesis